MDDLQQPVDLEAAGRFKAVMARLMGIAANLGKQPRWKPESFFRRFVQPAAPGAGTPASEAFAVVRR